MDIDTRDKQRIQKLQADSLLKKGSLIQLSEVTGKKDADIEDLFDQSFYIKLVNGAYIDELSGIELTEDDLSMLGEEPRIIKRISAFFKNKNIADGYFSHYLPAVYLLKEQNILLASLSETTIEKATVLFEKINSLLPT